MDKKRKILSIAIFVFMVFSLLVVTSQTYAYWSNSTNVTEDTATGSTPVGTWVQAFPYDPTYYYSVGDLATFNGLTYQAKSSGLLKEPGSPGYQSDWNDV